MPHITEKGRTPSHTLGGGLQALSANGKSDKRSLSGVDARADMRTVLPFVATLLMTGLRLLQPGKVDAPQGLLRGHDI